MKVYQSFSIIFINMVLLMAAGLNGAHTSYPTAAKPASPIFSSPMLMAASAAGMSSATMAAIKDAQKAALAGIAPMTAPATPTSTSTSSTPFPTPPLLNLSGTAPSPVSTPARELEAAFSAPSSPAIKAPALAIISGSSPTSSSSSVGISGSSPSSSSSSSSSTSSNSKDFAAQYKSSHAATVMPGAKRASAVAMATTTPLERAYTEIEQRTHELNAAKGQYAEVSQELMALEIGTKKRTAARAEHSKLQGQLTDLARDSARLTSDQLDEISVFKDPMPARSTPDTYIQALNIQGIALEQRILLLEKQLGQALQELSNLLHQTKLELQEKADLESLLIHNEALNKGAQRQRELSIAPRRQTHHKQDSLDMSGWVEADLGAAPQSASSSSSSGSASTGATQTAAAPQVLVPITGARFNYARPSLPPTPSVTPATPRHKPITLGLGTAHAPISASHLPAGDELLELQSIVGELVGQLSQLPSDVTAQLKIARERNAALRQEVAKQQRISADTLIIIPPVPQSVQLISRAEDLMKVIRNEYLFQKREPFVPLDPATHRNKQDTHTSINAIVEHNRLLNDAIIALQQQEGDVLIAIGKHGFGPKKHLKPKPVAAPASPQHSPADKKNAAATAASSAAPAAVMATPIVPAYSTASSSAPAGTAAQRALSPRGHRRRQADVTGGTIEAIIRANATEEALIRHGLGSNDDD